MNRTSKPPRPKETVEEIRPRSGRRDPRADPVTSPPPPMIKSQARLSRPPRGRDDPAASGSMAPAPPVTSEETLGTLRQTSVAQIRRIAALEHDLRDRDQLVSDLEKEVAALNRRDAEVEKLLEKAIAERDQMRSQAAEIEELRLSVDRAGAENVALEKTLSRETAEREKLTTEVARLRAVIEEIRKLAT